MQINSLSRSNSVAGLLQAPAEARSPCAEATGLRIEPVGHEGLCRPRRGNFCSGGLSRDDERTVMSQRETEPELATSFEVFSFPARLPCAASTCRCQRACKCFAVSMSLTTQVAHPHHKQSVRWLSASREEVSELGSKCCSVFTNAALRPR